MWTHNRQSKVTAATIDGYSKTHKYTQTFFHYPTRNPHCQTNYERKHAEQPAKTFRLKGQTEYKPHMYQSSLNPFKHNQSHYEKPVNITGDRKKTVNLYSNKATDPVNLTYQPYRRPINNSNLFQPSYAYKMEVQRRDYLPAERQLSKSRMLYHSQIGFSLSARDQVRPRAAINNSSSMKTTIQYQNGREINQYGCFDNFKYNSKK